MKETFNKLTEKMLKGDIQTTVFLSALGAIFIRAGKVVSAIETVTCFFSIMTHERIPGNELKSRGNIRIHLFNSMKCLSSYALFCFVQDSKRNRQITKIISGLPRLDLWIKCFVILNCCHSPVLFERLPTLEK
jgi:hypothetical protein